MLSIYGRNSKSTWRKELAKQTISVQLPISSSAIWRQGLQCKYFSQGVVKLKGNLTTSLIGNLHSNWGCRFSLLSRILSTGYWIIFHKSHPLIDKISGCLTNCGIRSCFTWWPLLSVLLAIPTTVLTLNCNIII